MITISEILKGSDYSWTQISKKRKFNKNNNLYHGTDI